MHLYFFKSSIIKLIFSIQVITSKINDHWCNRTKIHHNGKKWQINTFGFRVKATQDFSVWCIIKTNTPVEFAVFEIYSLLICLLKDSHTRVKWKKTNNSLFFFIKVFLIAVLLFNYVLNMLSCKQILWPAEICGIGMYDCLNMFQGLESVTWMAMKLGLFGTGWLRFAHLLLWWYWPLQDKRVFCSTIVFLSASVHHDGVK